MKTLVKRAAESRLYTFQFSTETEIAAGDTIASVTRVSADAGVPAGSAPTFGTPSIVNSSKDVTCQISGGSISNRYLLRCIIVTAAGSILERLGILFVTDDPA